MERQRELKALLKRWEADFVREQRRKPGQADIEAAPEDTRRLYREYRRLKKHNEGLDPAQLSLSHHPAAQETPNTEKVPDSDSWGSHLNRQPKAPGPSPHIIPKSSTQYYGMKLKSKLGAAGKEPPLTPRRPSVPKKIPTLPKTPVHPAKSEKTPSEPSLGVGKEEEEEEIGLLPPSVSGLAPLILTRGLKPPPSSSPVPKFQQLKQTVAKRLGTLDPDWLRRCQGVPSRDEATGMELGEVRRDPMEQEQAVMVNRLGTLDPDWLRRCQVAPSRDKDTGIDLADVGKDPPEQEREDLRRKRQRRDDAEAPVKLQRLVVKKEEEEQEAAHEKSRKVQKTPKIPEELEEKERPKGTRRARAPRQSNGNFVRLNLRRKIYVQGPALRGIHLRKQMRKQKWRKKFQHSASLDRSSDLCFRCGATGHWASTCPGSANNLLKDKEEEEEAEVSLPTLEEVARQTNSVCQDLPAANRSTDGDPSNSFLGPPMSPDMWKPSYEPPTAPNPVEPFFHPKEVQETPQEVLDALRALGYNSFRPGQEAAIMRILSGLSTLVILSTGMGKSLCYQLPAYLYHQRSQCITLVISPLVSLMDDQISGLPPCLKATCIHSNMTKPQREAAMEKVRGGEVQVLLLSPEALVGGSGSATGWLLSACQLPPVAFACIDEAHCLSEWSHNFRPCYLRLCKVLRNNLGVSCFLGLTATATMATAQDVAQQLGVVAQEGPMVRCSTVPSNLHLSVSADKDRDQALVSLLTGERFGPLDSIIIYCTRREETVRIAALIRTCLHRRSQEPTRATELLQDAPKKPKTKAKSSQQPPKWSADAYHAGLSPTERRRVQKSFMSGHLRLVVATVAFGMGLDKADVRGVIHYNMPRNFETYVQEIGRAGRNGEPAHCHLFLDPEGQDLHELRRHIYADTVDFFTVKELVRKVFPPCKCLELQQKHQDIMMHRVVEDVGVAKEEGDGDTTRPKGQRVCYRHKRAIPIQPAVESLDMREEAIETLLCYLELHPDHWLELLPHTYSSCRLLCYGGSQQLKAVAQKSLPVAVFLAQEHLAGREPEQGSSVEFDVVALSDSMGWEVPLVKRALRQLQWDQSLQQGGRSTGKNGILVEFGELSFHFCVYGDLSDQELELVCDFLHHRVVAREKTALSQLRTCFQAFQSVAFQNWGPNPKEEEEERSSRLKALLCDYFEGEPTGHEEEEDEEEHLVNNELWESQVRADIRHFLSIRPDEKFSGRAIARIFHGIGSPRFPAQIYGQDRRFWRKHLSFDFHHLCHLATEEILASR